MIYVEESSSAQSKCHALIIFLQVVVDFSCDKGGELALRKRFILIKRLTEKGDR